MLNLTSIAKGRKAAWDRPGSYLTVLTPFTFMSKQGMLMPPVPVYACPILSLFPWYGHFFFCAYLSPRFSE
jgi:hypothetical protein